MHSWVIMEKNVGCRKGWVYTRKLAHVVLYVENFFKDDSWLACILARKEATFHDQERFVLQTINWLNAGM